MKVAIGQDSHRIDFEKSDKKLVLGAVTFEGERPLLANSDGDVVLHAITNAVSGITCKNILGKVADKMCENGITDSKEYLKEALKYLKENIVHLSISVECKTPKLADKMELMRESIAKIMNINASQIGITATSGEGLTESGKGNGISVIAIITVE
ncbi:MAG: 2-C-methyl-D-erythritol 2,4-cyclodiphosphate synthase [Lachnospiraceae bacterium]|jgi:2-C-methyl-D-erythritol 2,4-cyclodiphosphate synthase|nr:2-C-methyl-D-erythritol 2,4-cyclodiphosphate synthase [Lachnospiraceae bacterium]